jgi:putative ABC transport system permease protein
MGHWSKGAWAGAHLRWMVDRDMSDLKLDVRQALRMLARRPVFALTATLTLALGIGVTSAVFTIVNALLLRPLPFADPERLVVVETRVAGERGKIALREFKALTGETAIFDDVAAYYPSQYNVTGGGRPEAIPTTISTHNLLRVLGFTPTIGSMWPASADFTRQFIVVLSHGLWQRRFGGDPNILGKKIRLDVAEYEVVGVAPPGADFPDRAEAFRSITDFNAEDQRRLWVVGRIRNSLTVDQARDAVAAFSQTMTARYPTTNTGVTFELEPIRDAHIGAARPYLWLLLGVVVFVLVIACANVGNLLLARAAERQTEWALREVLGAGRRRLAQQLLTETLLLSTIGGAAGLVLLVITLRSLSVIIQTQLPVWMTIQLDARVVIFTLGLMVLTGVIASVGPIITLSAEQRLSALGGSGKRAVGGAHRRFRQAFTVVQIAVALPLLVGAGLMTKSFWRLQEIDLGFRPDGLLTFRADPPYGKYNDIARTSWFYTRALEELRALPGVVDAATNQNLPIALLPDAISRTVFVEGQAPVQDGRQPFVAVQPVSPRYFGVMGIPLRTGRDFTEHDVESGQLVAIVNERFARLYWPGQDPVGRRLRLEGTVSTLVATSTNGQVAVQELPWLTIVGVAGNVKHADVIGPEGLDVYVPHMQVFAGDTHFIVRSTHSPNALRQQAMQAIWRIDPDQSVFAMQPMTAYISDAVWQQRLSGRLFGVFALLALALAVIGLYGVMAQMVGQRTREIGVRVALGATRTDVKRVVLGESARLTLAGSIIGLAAALVLVRALTHLLYDVAPYDPEILAGAALVLNATALAAAYIPARRAAALSPLTALRES